MMLTFLTLAHARGLTPIGYESEAKLESARKTMEGVEAQCFIANSVKAKVNFTPDFVVAPHQSENVLRIKRTLNRFENDLNRSPTNYRGAALLYAAAGLQ